MMESKPNLTTDDPNVNTGVVSIAELTMYVIQQKAANRFYNPKTDPVLLEWSKKGKFTLSTISANGNHNLIFNKGEVYETTYNSKRSRRSKSKFYPKNSRN